jgi:glucose/arabinose dehydrogenase
MRWFPKGRWTRRLAWVLIGLAVLALASMIVREVLLFPEVGLERILTGEQLELPLHLAEFPDGSGDLAVVEKTGRILWFHRDAERAGGVLTDLHERVHIEGYEDGLLSIAFHPRFRENGQFLAAYTARGPRALVISRFTVSGGGRRADPAGEEVILAIPKPGPNHNGGTLLFAPDGTLFISVGDSQQRRHGQDRTSLLGKILRIDPGRREGNRAYAIPPDNPFAAAKDGTRPEIWAYGFRNPWRISIDPETGAMYAGDVGSELYEEIDRVERGKNYGWAVFEGEQCIDRPEVCAQGGFEPPLAAFARVISRAVIGGHVYRGQALPWLRGRYVYGDLFRGLFAIDVDRSSVIHVPDVLLYRPTSEHGEHAGEQFTIASLAEDLSRELYVIDLKGGLYRIVPR